MLKFYRYSISTKRIFENMPNYEIRKQILVNPTKNRARIRYGPYRMVFRMQPFNLPPGWQLAFQTPFFVLDKMKPVITV